MLIFKYRIFFLVLLPAVFGSCRKDLYEAPIGSTYGDIFWTSQTSVEQATTAMYGQLRSCIRNSSAHFIDGDLAAGTFLPNAKQWNLASIKTSSNPPFNFSYVPYYEGVLTNPSRFYQLIAQANLILQKVPAMPSSAFTAESVRKSYIAEALFIRAYAYFYMIRIWGDPVYVTRTYDNVDYGNIPPLARTPEAAVLDSCLRDLKTAAAALSFSGGDPARAIRANKGSVCSVIAHVYAWQHQYDSAHFYCRQVITNGGYGLEPMSSYTNIWKGQSSGESIFELPMTYSYSDPNFSSQNDAAEAQLSFFATFLKGPLVDNQTSTCWIAPQGGVLDNIFDTADARYRTIFQSVPASGGDLAGHMLVKYVNFLYQQPGTKTLPYINNDLVLLRLADIYLLDAEALATLGDLGGAAADLAMTETRAGISSYLNPANQYDMLDEIVSERGRELVGEGQWFYDLIRTESTQGWLEFVGYPSARVTAANKGYYWPLDLTTLFPQDNLLVQNPWWATHH